MIGNLIYLLVRNGGSSNYQKQWQMQTIFTISYLYSILHRYLRSTSQGTYNYSENFGGAYYLFLRGIHQQNNPDDGIFFDCPTESIIQEMDQFLTPQNTL